MITTQFSDRDLMRARFVRGGRSVVDGLDCWGIVLAKLAQHGMPTLPDPWESLREQWASGKLEVGALIPAGWQVVWQASSSRPAQLAPGDVLFLGGDRLGAAFFDGKLCWTAQPGAGVVRLPFVRLPVVEVWRYAGN